MSKKNLLRLVVLVASLFTAASWAYRHYLNMPSPLILLDMELGWTPPSENFKYFSNRIIPKSNHPRGLDDQPERIDAMLSWGNAKNLRLLDFLTLTHTRAFLVVQDDKIVYERYFHADAGTIFPSYSMAKSVVATLVGVAVRKHQIASEDDPIGKYLHHGDVSPAYRSITIEQLLDMRSGIDVEERYDSITAPVVQMYLSTDLDRFLANVQGLRFPPGSRFEYRSVDTLFLAKVLSRATGKSLSEYLSEELWTPMSAEHDASWSLDSESKGVEKAFCCLNASARDFAKIGLLYLHEGTYDGVRLIDISWADSPRQQSNRSTTLSYAVHWWLPPGNAADRDFSAIGIYGQYIYVNPRTRTVIVKLSEHGIQQDEVLTLLALRRIAHIASGK
jgi:CubicO group peptidase (beta-lactamase class C family)